MPGAPQSAAKRVHICVHDIDVNKVVDTLVVPYPIPVIAAYESNIRKTRKALRGLIEDVFTVYGVLISVEEVHAGDVLKKT